MTPCLADTGSNYSTPLVMAIVGAVVLLIGVGVALLLAKKGKGAAGGALLVLFLVGAGTLGTTGASPARAASPSTSCTTETPTPVTTPTATSTPIVTPTPTPTPTPTCTPSSIAASVPQWGGIPVGGGLQFQGTVTDPALLKALGPHSFDGLHGSVAVTDTKSGTLVFSGDVTFGYDVAISTLLIPGSELAALAGEGSDWPFDQDTTLTLSFQRSGSNDCPIAIDVAGPAVPTE